MGSKVSIFQCKLAQPSSQIGLNQFTLFWLEQHFDFLHLAKLMKSLIISFANIADRKILEGLLSSPKKKTTTMYIIGCDSKYFKI